MADRGHHLFEYLCDFVHAQMGRLRVPGVAIGVHYQECSWTAGFGVTSVQNPLPVTTETIFQVGSISKTLTGTAVMALVERGQLDLDTRLKRYLPDLQLADPDATQHATMGHLLTHSWLGGQLLD